MAYKCLECGHIFEDGEEARWIERHGLEDPPYEHFAGCPLCLGAYEETVPCKFCYSEHLPDELYGGMCEECLEKHITYDNFLRYLLDSDDGLEVFMFEKVFRSSVPERYSKILHNTLVEWFLRKKADDLLSGRTSFLKKCVDYITKDDGEFGRECFAEWIAEGKRNG